MARTLIDLSMPVHNEMITFPRVVRPALVMFETWQGFAERIGARKYGVDSLTAHYMVVIGDHIGTHMDSLRHMRENAPGPEAVPLALGGCGGPRLPDAGYEWGRGCGEDEAG